MSGTYFTLNQKYNNLKTQTENSAVAPVPLPTSSTLADVLLNGNSAGSSDIDMTGNDIISSAGGVNILSSNGPTNITSNDFGNSELYINSFGGVNAGDGIMNVSTIKAPNTLALENAVGSGSDINLTADGGLNIIGNNGDLDLLSGVGVITLLANTDITLTSGTTNINLNTPLGSVFINGSAYPPVVSADTLSDVLTAGNTATNSITLNNTGTGTNVINLLPNASANDPNITLTDGTTTNTINKSGYTTRNSVQNLTHYLNFSDSSSTGTGAIQKNAGISCNPSTYDFNIGTSLTINGVGGNGKVAIGNQAGLTTQGNTSVAIGENAGVFTQGAGACAIGITAGQTSQGTNAVAVGRLAGSSNQLGSAVAIGNASGQTSQGLNAVAIGILAGNSNQLGSAVAIGNSAGQTSQSGSAVAVGRSAGNTSQGDSSVAIGYLAGLTSQGGSAVAIGVNAGRGTTSGQGANAIAIGNSAGQASQTAGSICLNASGVALNPNQAGCFVRPIRAGSAGSTFVPPLPANVLYYDTTTFEILRTT